MIQRIQSVYLAIITILTLVLFVSGFLDFTGENGAVIKLTVMGVARYTGQNSKDLIQTNYLNTILAAVVITISATSIFLYKRRNVQLMFVKALLVAEILFSGSIILSSYNAIHDYSSAFKPGIAIIVPIIQILLTLLAHSGIKKDDNLVKSYDRLR